MLSLRRWRASRRASPFLSLSRLSKCVWIFRLNSCMSIYVLAWRHTTPFPSGKMMCYYESASDSEHFRPILADALPPSDQEARPSAAYSELVDVLSCTTEKLSIDWPDEPRESQSSKLDERFLSGPNSRPVSHHRDVILCHIHALGLRMNTKKSVLSWSFSTNCVFRSSLGFRSNAGPSGSCPYFQPQYMFGPLQARPSCFQWALVAGSWASWPQPPLWCPWGCSTWGCSFGG